MSMTGVVKTEVVLVAADLPKGGVWKICYCTNFQGCDAYAEYTVEAGELTVQGADGIGTYDCVRYAPTCTFTVSGTVLTSGDYVQVIENGDTCATGAQSVNFVDPRKQADAGGSAVAQTFEPGTGSLQGVYRVCYCPAYDDGGGTACDGDAEYTHQAGSLDIRGPVGGEDKACTAGVQCTVGPFTGQTLSSDDKVGFMVSTGACITSDKDASTEIAQYQFKDMSITASVKTEVVLATADLPKGGVWKICYCTNFQSCDAFAEYTVEAGELTVQGADGIGTYDCVRYAPYCTFTVSGTVLTSGDYVQVIENGDTCATGSQ